jgi:hypothetical protein
MKRVIPFIVLAAICSITVRSLEAAQTNLVQKIHLKSTIYTQNEPVMNSTGTAITKSIQRNSFTTASLIGHFGEATGNQFSSNAQLLLITPVNGNRARIVVQDLGTRVDVSSYFEIEFEEDLAIERSSERVSTGAVSGTLYEVMKFRLRDEGNYGDLPLEFKVRGMAVVQRKTIFLEDRPIMADKIVAKMAGTGEYDADDKDFIIQVLLTITGGTIEVRP